MRDLYKCYCLFDSNNLTKAILSLIVTTTYFGILSPLGDDPKIVSGESGAVTLGALALISTDKR